MPDEPHEGTDLATVIDLADDAGLGYWRQEFGCTADQLLAAVESVGTDAQTVADFIHDCRLA